MALGKYVLTLLVVSLTGSLSVAGALTPWASVPAPSPTPLASPSAVFPDQMVVLAIGELVVLDGGLEVTFGAVVGDSRCPTSVRCVWQGNAEVVIEAAHPGDRPAALSLDTNAGFATRATYLDYVIELVDLAPYPKTASQIDLPYRVTLIVTVDEDRGPSAAASSG